MVKVYNIEPVYLAQHVIDQFSTKSGVYPGFKYLMRASTGLEPFSVAKIEFAAEYYNTHTEDLVNKLKETFGAVYGVQPQIIVYTPCQPPKAADNPAAE